MHAFDVVVTYDDAKFRVKGSASPFIPARVNCSNDDAAPAEGGVEEVTEVILLDKKGEPVELPSFLMEAVGELGDDDGFLEKIEDALANIEGDYE